MTTSPVDRVVALLEGIGLSSVDTATFEPVAQGASGRTIMRAYGVIAIVWTNERADNASFLPAARGLAALGLRVPRIISYWEDGEGNGACLVDDLGRTDLLNYKQEAVEDWVLLRERYRACFQTILPFYALRPDWELQAPFEESLYRWEQGYFAEHYLGRHRSYSLESQAEFLQQSIGIELAEDLASLPRMPIHRDLQSQNLMMKDDHAWLIDFQGMRMGRYEYDLASLIFDPYMGLSYEQRLDLLALWEELSGVQVDRALFCACGMQRMMQVLGAFANIGYNQEKSWYLDMIPAAEESLHQLGALAAEGTMAKRLYYMILTCL